MPGGSGVSKPIMNLLIIGGFLYLIKPVYGIFKRPAENDINSNNSNSGIMDFYKVELTPTETPTPTLTPTIIPTFTVQPIVNKDIYRFKYSYYYPALGGVNCHPDNWNEEKQTCKNLTASGIGWIENIGRGVAIAPSLLKDLPYGTRLDVVSPESIKGIYYVIDLCGACDNSPPGEYKWIDFLDNKQRLNWGDEVVAYVFR